MTTTRTSKTRVVLLQNVISPYRVPLFAGIARLPHVELCVQLTTQRFAPRSYWQRALDALPFTCVSSYAWCIQRGSGRVTVIAPFLLWSLVVRRPHVVITNGFSVSTALAWLYCAVARRKLVVWSESTEDTEAGISAAGRAYRRWLARRADGFLVAGRLARAYIESLVDDARRVQMHEARNCIDTARFVPKGLSVQERSSGRPPDRILFVGRLDENKGVRLVLQGFRELRRKPGFESACLTIVGDGPLRGVVAEAQAEMGVDRVRWLGHVAYEDMPAAYHEADVLVLASYKDRNPLVLLEAMACGVPIVCSKGCGNHVELVVEGVTGFSFPVGSVDALCASMEKVLRWCADQRGHARAAASAILAESSYERAVAAFNAAIAQEGAP